MFACVLHRRAPIGEALLRSEEVADPVPGPGDVLIRVRACAICRTDLHVVEGELPERRTPVIPGHQVVGEIVARGDGAGDRAGAGSSSDLAVGQRAGVAWLHR